MMLRQSFSTHKFRSFADSSKQGLAHGSGKVSTHVEKILENNKNWVEKTKKDGKSIPPIHPYTPLYTNMFYLDPQYFVNLGKAQKPKYLYIGCSDSRAPANQIMGLG